MESRKTVWISLFAAQQRRHRHREQTYGHGEGQEEEGGMFGENNMETCTLPYVK